jgi:hypothetical protein
VIPPSPASPAPIALRALGIEVARHSGDLHAANVQELMAWSYLGDPAVDPIDGMIASLKDDLSILQTAIDSGGMSDAMVQMQLCRLQHRAEAAHLLYQRMMNHVDRLLRDAEKLKAESADDGEDTAA